MTEQNCKRRRDGITLVLGGTGKTGRGAAASGAWERPVTLDKAG